MGKAIFQTEIIELGEQVDAFFEEGMFCLLYTSPTSEIKMDRHEKTQGASRRPSPEISDGQYGTIRKILCKLIL